MADTSKIEWTDATWNVVTGCSVKSPGCTNCYAMQLAGTRLSSHPSRAGLTRTVNGNHVWTGEIRFNQQWLDQPLRWRRPRRVFVCAHGDLFHEDVPDEWIDRVFAVMALCPQHTFQVLTKRADRMREYCKATEEQWHGNTDMFADRFNAAMDWNHAWINDIDDMQWPLPNVWLGVSVEDQARADERIPDLLATPAAIRFLSCEPLLGPLDLYNGEPDPRLGGHEATATYIGDWWEHDDPPGSPSRHGLDWIIAGGESGPDARPMHPDWVRSLRDQCQAAEVPFFFKQNGEFAPGEIAGDYLDPEKPAKGLRLFDSRWDECWSEPEGHVDDEPDVYRIGKKRAGRLLDGREWSEFPA